MIAQQRLLILFAMFAVGADAQWLNFPTPGMPRTRDGKPNLAAPAPRTANGKPDLSGVWRHPVTSAEELKRIFGDRLEAALKTSVAGMEIDATYKYARNILLDAGSPELLMRPQAAEIVRKRNPAGLNPTYCLPIGIPLAGFLAEPNKIVQSPAMTVILYESDGSHRQIYTDGRALPKEIAQPAWLGYSVGKWERDMLVVETAGFNAKTALDLMGHPHSESLRVTERYRRTDFGHLDTEMTFDDPEMYTRPFTIKFTQELQADSDIFENVCNENEKDRVHMGLK